MQRPYRALRLRCRLGFSVPQQVLPLRALQLTARGSNPKQGGASRTAFLALKQLKSSIHFTLLVRREVGAGFFDVGILAQFTD